MFLLHFAGPMCPMPIQLLGITLELLGITLELVGNLLFSFIVSDVS